MTNSGRKFNESSFKIKITGLNASVAIQRDALCVNAISLPPNGVAVGDVADAFRWAKAMFPRSEALIGDTLYALTYQIRLGASREEAVARSNEVATKIGEAIRDALHPADTIIKRTSQVQADEDYPEAVSAIAALYHREADFRLSIIESAERYVGRQAKAGILKHSYADAVDVSVSYLLQEVAIYLRLASQGYLLDVYLGEEIPALKKIMNGEIATAPDPLKARVNISLRRRRTTRDHSV